MQIFFWKMLTKVNRGSLRSWFERFLIWETFIQRSSEKQVLKPIYVTIPPVVPLYIEG